MLTYIADSDRLDIDAYHVSGCPLAAVNAIIAADGYIEPHRTFIVFIYDLLTLKSSYIPL
jgi:hypothetical protein